MRVVLGGLLLERMQCENFIDVCKLPVFSSSTSLSELGDVTGTVEVLKRLAIDRVEDMQAFKTAFRIKEDAKRITLERLRFGVDEDVPILEMLPHTFHDYLTEFAYEFTCFATTLDGKMLFIFDRNTYELIRDAMSNAESENEMKE